MAKFILGRKLGMTTVYTDNGAQNVTLVECGGKVSLIRTLKKDGYQAVQVVFSKTSKRKIFQEFRVEDASFEVGTELNASIFKVGDIVNVRGVTKGKGFQGGVKRHGFKGSPKTHGHKHDLRAPGSIGAGFPEHVIKGKRMAGRMGGLAATVKNIKLVHIDLEKNILGLKGSVPGIPGGVVAIEVR